MHLFFALLFSFQGLAASYIVNKEHSKLKFNVKYMALTEVEGQFDDYKIYFEKTKDSIENLKGEIYIDSVDTFDKKRNQHLKKPAFFDAKKFPIIKFHSLSPIPLKKKEITSKISIELKGIKKQIPLKLTYLGKRVDPWTKKEGIYFKGSLKINRFDFGVNWSKQFDGGLVVGKDVYINFTVEAYQSNDKPAFSRFYLPTKSIKRNVDYDAQPSDGELIKPKKKAPKTTTTSKKPREDSYSDFSNIALTLISTALLFAVTIVCGIFAMSRLANKLEAMGLSDNLTLLIASTVVTAIIAILFYISSKYTGIGIHPLFSPK